MTRGRDGAALRQLRTLLERGSVGQLSDVELVERFLARSGDEAESAFAALVERHGSAVLRVCRSVLGDREAAQDAFQATFLVLLRKAGSVRFRDSLGPWLVAVAYRTASGARSSAGRRRIIERDAAGVRASIEPPDEDLAREVRAEVDRLADRYRRPILLCYFAGLTHEGAARQLGCPVGTVRSRLAWGRKQLRERLLRRGLAPALAFGSLAATPGRAAVPTTLSIQTVRAAARLGSSGEAAAGSVSAAAVAQAERILRAMFMTKLKGLAAAVLMVALVASGGVVLAQQKDNPGSPFAEKKEQLGLFLPQKDNANSPARPPARPAPKVRPDVEIEMLLRAAREQEQAGHRDQALALTARMDEALRAWRTKLQDESALAPVGPEHNDIKRLVGLPGEAVAKIQIGSDEPARSVVSHDAVRLENLDRRMSISKDVERAAVPFPDTKVVEFPGAEDWRKLVERRIKRGAAAKLDAPAIRARLDGKISLHFAGPFPLEEALKVIRAATAGPEDEGLPIYVDPEGLRKAKATLGSPVSLDVEGAPLGQALKMVLVQVGLAYDVRDGMIIIDAPRAETPLRK